MNKFQYLTSEPEDLFSIEIEGNRVKLVTMLEPQSLAFGSSRMLMDAVMDEKPFR